MKIELSNDDFKANLEMIFEIIENSETLSSNTKRALYSYKTFTNLVSKHPSFIVINPYVTLEVEGESFYVGIKDNYTKLQSINYSTESYNLVAFIHNLRLYIIYENEKRLHLFLHRIVIEDFSNDKSDTSREITENYKGGALLLASKHCRKIDSDLMLFEIGDLK